MVYEVLCNKLYNDYKINKSELLNELIERDRKGFTTMGNGIATPYIQNNFIKKPICIVSVLSTGIDFDLLIRYQLTSFFCLFYLK